MALQGYKAGTFLGFDGGVVNATDSGLEASTAQFGVYESEWYTEAVPEGTGSGSGSWIADESNYNNWSVRAEFWDGADWAIQGDALNTWYKVSTGAGWSVQRTFAEGSGSTYAVIRISFRFDPTSTVYNTGVVELTASIP